MQKEAQQQKEWQHYAIRLLQLTYVLISYFKTPSASYTLVGLQYKQNLQGMAKQHILCKIFLDLKKLF